MRRSCLAFPLVGLLFFWAPSLDGQWTFAISGGAAQYGLDGTGRAPVVGVHFFFSRNRWIWSEVGTGVFSYSPGDQPRTAMLLPEAAAGLKGPDDFPAYLGVGLGHSLTVMGDESNHFVALLVGGFVLPVGDTWRLRPEARLRSLDIFGWLNAVSIGIARPMG